MAPGVFPLKASVNELKQELARQRPEVSSNVLEEQLLGELKEAVSREFLQGFHSTVLAGPPPMVPTAAPSLHSAQLSCQSESLAHFDWRVARHLWVKLGTPLISSS